MKIPSAASFLLAATAWLLTCLLISPLPAQDEDDGGFKYLEVTVLDPDGKPMTDVEVEISMDGTSFPMPVDDQGMIGMNVPSGKNSRLALKVIKKGYAAMGVTWNKGVTIPTEFTIPMQKGTAIGGIVHDEQGNPIEGVTVKGHDSIDDYGTSKVKLQPRLNGELGTTDADGRWRIDSAPETPMQLQLQFAHPDYVNNNSYGFRGGTWEQLLSLDNMVVLKKGIELRGKVVDADDQPIAGAKVAIGTGVYYSNRRTVETNEKGEYQFANVTDGQNTVVVTSSSWAPDLKRVSVKRDIEPVDFQLPPGNEISIKITDAKGQPLQGVTISPRKWRGCEVLERSPIKSDAEGLWSWNGAPSDEIQYNFYLKGYMSVSDLPLTASSDRHEITLGPPLVITGRVVDSETKQPINEFQVVEGIRWHVTNERVVWQQHRKKLGENGTYRVEYNSPHQGYRIKIEAKDYRPKVSRFIASDSGEVTIDFELEAGTGPSGVVQSADGKPVEGAVVVMASANQHIQISNGQYQQHSNSANVETDAKGRFALPFPEGNYRILCLHDTGWAEAKGSESDDSHELTLQPWSQIRGKLLQGKEPVAGEGVNLHFQQAHQRNQPNIYWSYSSKTDGEGAFHFQRVKAGIASVGRQIRYGDQASGRSMGTTTHSEPVEVKPGETAKIQIGGTGRIVKGQLTPPDDFQGTVPWKMGTVNINQQPNVGPKSAFQAIGRAIAQLGQKSAQPRQRAHRKNYVGTIADDGTFEIHDVLPGSFQMRVNIFQLLEDGNYNWNNFATLNLSLTIPEGNDPYDTGNHTLTIPKPKPTNGTTGTLNLQVAP